MAASEKGYFNNMTCEACGEFFSPTYWRKGVPRFCGPACRSVGNKREWSADVSEGFARIPLSQGASAIIDIADLDIVKGFSWYLFKTGEQRYARTAVQRDGKITRIFMHRLIMGLTETGALLVDHVDGDGLNNRRANLRHCDTRQNQQNRKPTTSSASGYKGVFPQPDGKWRARIYSDSTGETLGYFKDKRVAALAYNIAAYRKFGAFARFNKIS